MNEELRRDMQTHTAEREGANQESVTPPREFPAPFSPEIVDTVIPATLVGPKVTFTRVEDLIAIPNIAERLKVPPKSNKNAWCEFHQAYDHPIRNCLALGHLLDELVKNGIIRDYLQEKQGIEDVAATGGMVRGMKFPCTVRSTPSQEGSRVEAVPPLSEGDTCEQWCR